MKSTEVGHSIKNEIEHNRKYQSASHIYWVKLISSINVCVCVVISNVFLTASCGQTILEAIVQVYFPGSILFSELPYRPLQINLTKALLLAFHFLAEKPSIFKNLGSISTPQQSTEKGTYDVAPTRVSTRINEASTQKLASWLFAPNTLDALSPHTFFKLFFSFTTETVHTWEVKVQLQSHPLIEVSLDDATPTFSVPLALLWTPGTSRTLAKDKDRFL